MVVLYLVFNNCPRTLRVKCIFYPDGNILNSYRIDGGRIYHFGTEITKFHGLYIAKLINSIG